MYGLAQSRDIPRNASGRPNLSGIWQALGNAHWDIEPHQASAAMALVPGPLIPVPAPEVVAFGAIGAVPPGMGIVEGGVIPYLPDALALRDQNHENWLTRDPVIKCYLPGVPRATYMPFPFQIFQSESAFFITYEYAGADRNVYLQDPGPAQVDSWMGQSVGHWEGDTFVVEVAGFTGQAWLDRAGNHHSLCDDGSRAVHDDRPGPHHVRSHDDRSEYVFSSVDDPAPAVQTHRGQRSGRCIQVCGVRGGTPVWAVPEGHDWRTEEVGGPCDASPTLRR